MRGSALIFNSLDELDPETLDKIDDLTSLDSDLEDDFFIHNQEDSQEYSTNGMSIRANFYETRNASLTHSQENESLQKESALNFTKTESVHNHNLLKTKSSPIITDQFSDSAYSSNSSPPLNKSNYFEGAETISRSKSQYFIPTEVNPGRVVLSKTFASNGTGLPLSRISKVSTLTKPTTTTTSTVPDYGSENSRGFSRFLFKSSRQVKDRFDVNNLPPQLREETKRIYVY